MRRTLALLAVASTLVGCPPLCPVIALPPDQVVAAPAAGAASIVPGVYVNFVEVRVGDKLDGYVDVAPAVDATGRLVLPTSYELARYGPDGGAGSLAPTPRSGAYAAVAARADGSLIAADVRGMKLWRVGADGGWTEHATLPIWSPTEDGRADRRGPRLAAPDASGDLFLAQQDVLYRVSAGGGVPVPLGADAAFRTIVDMAPDPAGGVLVVGRRGADAEPGAWQVSAKGEVTRRALPALIHAPVALAVAGGRLHVADQVPGGPLTVYRVGADEGLDPLLMGIFEDDPRIGKQVYALKCSPAYPDRQVLTALVGDPAGTLWAVVSGKLVRIGAQASPDPGL